MRSGHAVSCGFCGLGLVNETDSARGQPASGAASSSLSLSPGAQRGM